MIKEPNFLFEADSNHLYSCATGPRCFGPSRTEIRLAVRVVPIFVTPPTLRTWVTDPLSSHFYTSSGLLVNSPLLSASYEVMSAEF